MMMSPVIHVMRALSALLLITRFADLITDAKAQN
jgi:hypothetical protein